MYLDYTQIAFDKFGRPEPPNLLLQTADERTIGTLPNVANPVTALKRLSR